jgi:gluconolactonase
MTAAGIERLVEKNPPLDRIAHGQVFGEGPVWDRRKGELYWVEIIGNTIWKWKPGVGSSVVLKPSSHANGMTFDQQGRLTVAGWSKRSVWRFEHDGSITTIASHYQGKKINSPNDIVVKSDGSTWFTDSAGGLVIPGMVAEDVQRYLPFQGVYRITPDGKALQLAIEDVSYPNGLCFSPDEKRLYVNDSRMGIIRVWKVSSGNQVSGGKVFHKMQGADAGVADGMKCDVEGNVYCTGPGGVHIISPAGKLLGRLKVPGHSTNMCWGDDDWCSLYVTTYDSVYRTRVKVPGVAVW